MISSHTMKRLEGELELQETKLRNLFHSIYVEDGRAWDIWTYEVEAKGLKKTLKRIQERPKTFGPLKGHLRLGFIKDKDIEDRERAQKELSFQAERWRFAQLQVEQSKARLEEIAKHEADQPKNEQPKRETGRPAEASRER